MTEVAMSSKTAVITGATSGIGLASARILAARGLYVIGVGRSKSRCSQAEALIREETPAARSSFLIADLSSQRQVLNLGDSIQELLEQQSGGRLDVLINNAATVPNWYVATEDGYEMQFAVNHLAGFLLTHKLFPALQKSTSGRIITVSSGSHYHTRIHWNDLMYRKHYNCLWAYKQSKLANVLFTQELNRRFAVGQNMNAFVVDPGLVNTEIGAKGTGGLIRWFWNIRRHSGVAPEVAARTIVYLSVTLDISQKDAIYWKECRPVEPSRYSQRRDVAARLWEISEHLCGLASPPGNEIKKDLLNGSDELEAV